MINKEKISSLYAESTFFTRFKQVYREKICPFHPIEKYLPKENYSMLDVGCGSGWFGVKNTINKKGIKYIGLDSNSEVLNDAKKAIDNAKKQGLILDGTTHNYVSNFEEIKKYGSFDVIVVIDVIHHVKNKGLKNFIKELRDNLSNDGVIIIKDMNSKPFLMKCINQAHDLILSREWIEHIEIDYLSRVATEHELTINSCVEYTCGLYSHYLLVASHDS